MATPDDRNIEVSDETARLIREKVEDGSFASPAEVVEAAMAAMAHQEEDRAQRLLEIKARIRASAEDMRPGYSSEDMREHFRKLYDKAAGKRHDSAA